MNDAFAKLISVFLLMLGCVGISPSQTTCEFSPKTAPLLLNLRPGMSSEEVQSVLGKSPKIKVKKDGEKIFFESYAEKRAPAALRNVNAFYLRFFDRKLYQIEIFYNPRTDLPNLEAITNNLSQQLNFSPQTWQIKNKRAAVKCNELSLKADSILNPHIELTDEIIRKTVEEKRQSEK